MSPVRFIPSAAGIAELEEEFKVARKAIGTAIQKNVEHVAPVGTTGLYHKSIVVDDDGSVGTTDPFGHLVEWGSVNNPPYAPIRRGVKATGLRLSEEDKT